MVGVLTLFGETDLQPVLAKRFMECGEENPYRVYYFPTNGQPWDMVYRENGRFEKEFGEGFTDESSLLAYQLL